MSELIRDQGNSRSQISMRSNQHNTTQIKTDSSRIHTSVNESADGDDVQLDKSFTRARQGTKEAQALEKIRSSRVESKTFREVVTRAFALVEKGDAKELMLHLEANPSYHLHEIIDHRGYTLLHASCFKNTEAIASYLIDRARSTLTDRGMHEFVNHKTEDDGFSALHFCSFRGNLTLIQLLISVGADIYCRNNYGINVLHVGAQGDQPLSLFFFKEKGIDLRSVDNRGSTPLHWACYSKSEVALCYLLAWVEILDDQDIEGYTPLHLAVKSVETLRSTRPVRSLLIKGASRAKKDHEGKAAMELASEISNAHLQMELKQMLKEPANFSCLMIKTPLKLVKKSWTTTIFFLLLIALNYLLLFFFAFPCKIP